MNTPAVEYLKKLQSLLLIEEEEDYNQYREAFLKSNVSQRRENGLTWYPIVIKEESQAYGNMLQLEIERTNGLNQPHQFSNGKVVALFSQKENNKEEIHGIVKTVHANSMKLVFNTDELPDWCYEGKLGLDILFDKTSYQEMQDALAMVISATNNRTAELREILQGNRPANFKSELEDLINPQLNLSQNRALRKCMSAQDVAVIHGPPGTGKTTTLIQIARLLLQSEKQILVCAPTNTAVDHLSEKLSEEGLEVIRIGNPARVSDAVQKTTLDGKVYNHPNAKEIKTLRKNAEEYFKMASKYKRVFGKEEAQQRTLYYQTAKECLKEARLLEDYITSNLIEQAQVICCTPVQANHALLKSRKFNTLILDEASQCLEPMAWIPLLKCNRIILGGDHFQLSPVVKSRKAEKEGLSLTLLDRVMNLPNISALLTLQYRMHHSIMNFSNQFFYSGKLEADNSVKETRFSYDENEPLLYHPVEFIDTAGCGFEEELNPESLSLKNPGESKIINDHLSEMLIQLGKTNINTETISIGIIAPYKEQQEFLKLEILSDEKLSPYKNQISVKTIDGFQGEERDIIYISFVRSNSNGEIGFLNDLRRTNVALTRARKKLVMVGDSATLGAHPFYQKLLEYSEKNGYYRSGWEFIN